MNAEQADLTSDDAGLSLVEVIVAIAVILIVATSSASLFISGLKSSSAQEQRQIAVTVASDLLGDVSALSAAKDPTTGVSVLLAGRTRSAVTTLWDNSVGIEGLAQTYQAWDPSAGSVVAIPLSGSVERSGTIFTTQTIIGTCYQRQRTGGQCTLIPGYGSAPATTPAGYSSLLRVIVTVRWGVSDSYQATTLVDPSSDVSWVTRG